MIYPGMSLVNYFAILRQPHQVRVRVLALDMDHNLIDDVSDQLIDGTVDIDFEGDITRSLSLELMDLNRDLNLDSLQSARAGTYYTTMFQIWYGVRKFLDTDWVEVPIFTGPITSLDRDGALISIECASKEIMASEGLWSGRTWPKGTRKRNVIRTGMSEIFGEAFFSMDQASGDLGADWSIKRGEDAFKRFRNLARTMKCQLFYGGDGRLRLRERNLNPVFTFDNYWITSIPEIGYDLENVVNAVRVTGGLEIGGSQKYWFSVIAPDHHKLSPYSLRRNGVRRYLPLFIEDDSLKTVKEIQDAAFNELEDGLVSSTLPSFNALVNPILEEGDVYNIACTWFQGKAKFQEASIPLVGDAEMSVGFKSTSNSPSKERLKKGARTHHAKRKKKRGKRDKK